METNTNLPVNMQAFTQLMQNAPDILVRNELSVSKCNDAGQTLIDTIEANGGITSDELDTDVANYINKVRVTIKNMNERRKPITQLLQMLGKRFTSLESDIDLKGDTIPAKLQAYRNQFAAKKIEEQRKREEEARKHQAVENEKASYGAELAMLLESAFSAYLKKSTDYVQSEYERTTIENYQERVADLKNLSVEFNFAHFEKNVVDNIQLLYLSASQKDEIKKSVYLKSKEVFEKRFVETMSDVKQSTLDMMPSKLKALKEEAELAKQNAELAQKAEAERKAREAEIAQKAEAERKAREAEIAQKAEAEKQAKLAMASFDFMNAAAPTTQTKAKVQKAIKVLNPKGFIEVYQLWFMKEGVNMSMYDLEKVHKKMLTFCNKEANKENGEIIKSSFVQYVDEVKAK